MVVLRNMSLPLASWCSAKLLRAIPNCLLVLLIAYHMMSPALSTEEASLMSYLQTPPMQDWRSIKQLQAFRIGSVSAEDWCKLVVDCPQPINYISLL